MSRLLALAMGLFLLAGCRAKTPPAAAASPSPSPKINPLRGVDLTLEAGAPVQKDVEAVIDANAKHNQDIQNLADPKD